MLLLQPLPSSAARATAARAPLRGKSAPLQLWAAPGPLRAHRGLIASGYVRGGRLAVAAGATGGKEGGKEEGEMSSFGGTSGPVKALVGGLTSLLNFAMGSRGEVADYDPASRGPPVPPSVLRAGVEEDFTENGYLWTGEITDDLYDMDCIFTDPTLSFRGLETFKRNLHNLQPVLKALVKERDIELYSCTLDEGAGQRMMGEFALPWSPRLELDGQTVFSYDAARGGRIVSYDESWGITAADALLQLLRPGKK